MPKGYNTVSTFNPEQQQLFSRLMQALSGQNLSVGANPLYQSGSNYLQNLLQGGDEAFSAFEAPYKRQFNEQTIPGIAERFSGAGAGAQSSSAFQQALGQAGAGLSENLASLRSGLQMSALPTAFSAAGIPGEQAQGLLGLNTQALLPKQQSFWKQFLLGLAPGISSGATMGLSGGMGGLGDLFGGWQSSYGGNAQSRGAGQGITQTRLRR